MKKLLFVLCLAPACAVGSPDDADDGPPPEPPACVDACQFGWTCDVSVGWRCWDPDPYGRVECLPPGDDHPACPGYAP